MSNSVPEPRSHTRLAPAKINLSLHIMGRRHDGYHALESLVAFSEQGDQLHFQAGIQDGGKPQVSLTLEGIFAGELAATQSDRNLVLKAVNLLRQRTGFLPSGCFILEKELPIASGIGGGSADAAAALNILQDLNPSPVTKEILEEIALELGADVPMCLTPQAQMVWGIGEKTRLMTPFPALPAVLVNPGVAIATADIFARLKAADLTDNFAGARAVLPKFKNRSQLYQWLQQKRNDLQKPAILLVPLITDVLAQIGNSKHCRMARMSGSGATCFGLYDRREDAQYAAKALKARHPDWWVVSTVLT